MALEPDQEDQVMGLDEAKRAVLTGLPFGSVYPMLDEPDRGDFRWWYVREPKLPNLVGRRHLVAPVTVGCGYTGNACPSCQSVRMVRRGSCECCNDCGDSTSCG